MANTPIWEVGNQTLSIMAYKILLRQEKLRFLQSTLWQKKKTKQKKKQLTDKIYIIQSYVKPCKVNAIQRN